MATYVFEVKVVSGKYEIDGYTTPALELGHDISYRFTQSDSSNATHPLRFSTTSDGTHNSGSEYTTGVTTAGTPGSSGAYTEISVTSSTPATLYYYCSGHSGMGGAVTTTSAEYIATSNVALRKPILGNSDSWGHYVNQNINTVDDKLFIVKDGVAMHDAQIDHAVTIPANYGATMAGPVTIGTNGSLTVNGTLVIV
jgi:hypothetical protein